MHVDYIVWMITKLRDDGHTVVDVHPEPEQNYSDHCRQADIDTAPLRDCLTYYNGDGNAEPGSLAYYGGNRWHKWRLRAQETLDPYILD